jgi:L-ribulose-5-phosphate 3-epimerase
VQSYTKTSRYQTETRPDATQLAAASQNPEPNSAFGLPLPIAKTILRANQSCIPNEIFIDNAIQPMEPLMNTGFNRRQFLAATGAAAAVGATGNLAKANILNSPPAKDELFEISLAQWSLHRTLRSGKLDNLDFAKVAKEEFGISGIEYVNQFFKDKAEDEKYLGQMKKRAADHGVESVLIMIDGEGALGDANDAAREKAIENHYKWVSAAKFLGCHSIRVNAKSKGTYQAQVSLAADGLARLSQYADKMGINVLVENHGGLSSNGQWLAQVIRKVNMNNCGTLPDFGNFRIGNNKKTGKQEVYDRYMGMSALLPFAKAVSAKSHDFDADGNETSTEYMKVMQMVLDSGYHGWVGIEYEGGKLSEADGIKATKKLLLSCREKLNNA